MLEPMFADLKSARLAYVETGTGDPVVLVHGAFSDHRFWSTQIQDVAKTHRCLAIDQRYCGASWMEPTDAYSLTTHAEDLNDFVASVAGAPAHVVATSYGSAVALAWAAANPQACASLFLNEPALVSLVTQPEDVAVLVRARAELAPVAAALSAGDSARAVRLFCDWTSFPGGFDTLPPQVQAIFIDNARTVSLAFSAPAPKIVPNDLTGITMPVTLSFGAQTSPFFLVQVQAAHRALPQSRLVQIPDSHHAAPLQNAAAFNNALRQHFLAAQQAAA